MPIISKISAQKKPGRYNIFLDGKYAFSASEQTVAKFVLLKGRKLTDEKKLLKLSTMMMVPEQLI